MALRVNEASRDELPLLYALRHEVFVVGQGVDPQLERDEFDDAAVHVAAYDEAGRLVGTGRSIGGPPGAAKVGRMAVAPAARGQGVGAAVLRCLERGAARRGNSEVVLHAQVHAIGFYERAGYEPLGARFTEAGIEHQTMRKSLPRIRDVRDDDSATLIALIGGVWAEYPGCVLDVDGEEPWLRAPASTYAAWGGRFWVATVDSALVACVGLKPVAPGVAELKTLYVAAKARRRGLGELLTSVVEDEARRRGANRIELWSDSRFTDAHRLYTRLGYQRLPRTRDLHDLSNTTEYAFSKVLSAQS